MSPLVGNSWKEKQGSRDDEVGDRRGISRNRARLIQSGVPQAQLQAQTMAPRQRHCPAYDIKKEREEEKGEKKCEVPSL